MGIKEADNRPCWDIYFMAMAFLVSQRSIDQHMKCGCVIVSKDKRILSTGYNGPIKNSDDSKIPLTRPEKYAWIIHSEINAILSYNGSLSDIDGSSIYVTARPCHNCMKAIIQKGIKNIIYCDSKIPFCVDDKDQEITDKMINEHNIQIKTLNEAEVISFFKKIH